MATPLGNVVGNSANPLINGLIQGSKWSSTNLTYSFWNSEYGYWSASDKALVGLAFQQWSNVANIRFQEVSPAGIDVNNSSDISMEFTGNLLNAINGYENSPQILAEAVFPDPAYVNKFLASLGIPASYWPTAAGDIMIENYHTGFQYPNPGQLGFFAILHEIGHSLGLKHPHDDGENSRPDFDQLELANLNNQVFTVMSYKPVYGATIDAGNPATPMPLDILAIQHIYGANMSTRAGNDIYHLSDDRITETIWDAGGSDTFDSSGVTSSVLIDLTPGSLSLVGNTLGAIAYNTIIENVIGSIGGDFIIGNEANNVLSGEVGNDIISGYNGSDLITGGLGNDDLNGNLGIDTVNGGDGNDILRGGKDVDTVLGGLGDDWLNGNLGNDTVAGELGNDTVRGGLDNDTLNAGDGNDYLLGDKGNDILLGGSGADVFGFRLESGADVIQDFSTGVDKIKIDPLVIVSALSAIGAVTYASGNALIDLGSGNNITLIGVASGLSVGDFLISSDF